MAGAGRIQPDWTGTAPVPNTYVAQVQTATPGNRTATTDPRTTSPLLLASRLSDCKSADLRPRPAKFRGTATTTTGRFPRSNGPSTGQYGGPQTVSSGHYRAAIECHDQAIWTFRPGGPRSSKLTVRLHTKWLPSVVSRLHIDENDASWALVRSSRSITWCSSAATWRRRKRSTAM
jgi:hypothetical protein